MAPTFLPSGLYTSGSLSMATLAAAARQQEQQQPVAAFSPAESTLKAKFLQGAGVTAFAPVEKKIEMYSRVGCRAGERNARPGQGACHKPCMPSVTCREWGPHPAVAPARTSSLRCNRP